MSIARKFVASGLGLFAAGTPAAFAGAYSSNPSVDNGATAGAVLLLALVAVVMLKGGVGASASAKREDKAADEE